MNSRFRHTGPIVIALLFGLSSYANADLVTFAFQGSVNQVIDTNDVLPESVTVGAPFSGTYTFDANTPGVPAPPFLGHTRYDAITDVTGQAAGVSFVTGDHGAGSEPGIIVGDYFPGASFVSDTYRLRTPVAILGQELFFRIDLFDSLNRMFQDNTLPVVPPALDLTTSRSMTILNNNQSLFIIASVDSLEFVPEPSTAMILLAAATTLSPRRALARQGRFPAQSSVT